MFPRDTGGGIRTKNTNKKVLGYPLYYSLSARWFIDNRHGLSMNEYEIEENKNVYSVSSRLKKPHTPWWRGAKTSDKLAILFSRLIDARARSRPLDDECRCSAHQHAVLTTSLVVYYSRPTLIEVKKIIIILQAAARRNRENGFRRVFTITLPFTATHQFSASDEGRWAKSNGTTPGDIRNSAVTNVCFFI